MANRIERLKNIGNAKSIDAFLFTSLSTIKCFSGYYYNFEIGPSPFQFLPAALLIVPSRNSSIIIADNESFESEGSASEILVKLYESYVYKKPLDFTAQFLLQLHETLNENNLMHARIGIEQNSLPFVVSQSITSEYPNLKLVDVTDAINYLKAVKDIDEIENIRKATALCDIGQAAVLKHARAGLTELELFSLIRTEMEASVGTRVPIMLDLVSGARTEEGGGIPSNNIIRQGNLVLSDLTPCLKGYWGDTCNTVVIGKPTEIQYDHFKLVQHALQSAIEFIKPGIKAKEVDQLLRKHLSSVGEYGHHSGHGVGTTNHEEPRIVPYNEMMLEENMVIALEPAIYTKGYGIRLEHLVLVNESGCEPISKFNHCFEQNL
jgi:Xaa-Pro dipeptidase